MPTEKTNIKRALIAKEEVQVGLRYREGVPGEPDAEPPVAAVPPRLIFSLTFKHEDGESRRVNRVLNELLPLAADRSKFRSLLAKASAKLIADDGYTTS